MITLLPNSLTYFSNACWLVGKGVVSDFEEGGGRGERGGAHLADYKWTQLLPFTRLQITRKGIFL